jgi:hypothetical protein
LLLPLDDEALEDNSPEPSPTESGGEEGGEESGSEGGAEGGGDELGMDEEPTEDARPERGMI